MPSVLENWQLEFFPRCSKQAHVCFLSFFSFFRCATVISSEPAFDTDRRDAGSLSHIWHVSYYLICTHSVTLDVVKRKRNEWGRRLSGHEAWPRSLSSFFFPQSLLIIKAHDAHHLRSVRSTKLGDERDTEASLWHPVNKTKAFSMSTIYVKGHLPVDIDRRLLTSSRAPPYRLRLHTPRG
jgi:hypothetical protein